MKNLNTLIVAAALTAVLPTAALAEKAPTVGESILGVEVNVARVVTSGYSANQLIGAIVHNDQQKEIGTVHDLIIATNGDISLAIVEVGGFIGIGSKWVAVPASMFQPGENSDVILPKATQDELKKMPAFRYAQ